MAALSEDAQRTVLFDKVASKDFLNFSFGSSAYQRQIDDAVQKTGQLCAVQCTVRNLNGEDVVWLQHDFGFLGGSLGCAEGEILCRGFEYAKEHCLPVVIECQSGGARMQEGTLSLMQLGKVSVCVQAHRTAGLPFISILTDPTYGGVPASYAMQSDVRIGVSGARIGFAGPAVILNTMYEMNQTNYDQECPADFQSAEYLQAHGQLDIVVTKEEGETQTDALERTVSDVLVVLQPRSVARPDEVGGGSTMIKESDSSSDDERDVSPSIAPGQYANSRSMVRPQCQDMIEDIFDHFVELSGDGRVGDDGCIRGGLARLDGDCRAVVIASFKGHTPSAMQTANYGMSSPHGYRKALRLMKLAETFGLPVITLVDTCGALPNFEAESNGQSEAIATNLTTMAGLTVPIVTIIVGEGGSGGALGIGMGNVVGMLSSAYYGVISPEGAASILGRYTSETHKASQFPVDCAALATLQKIYAPQLKELGVIDHVIQEVEDETYQSFSRLSRRIRTFLAQNLSKLSKLSADEIVQHRYDKFRRMGKYDMLSAKQRETVLTQAQNRPKRARAPRTKPDQTPSKTLSFIAEQSFNGPYSRLKGKAPAGVAAWVPGKLAVAGAEAAPLPVRENAKSILDAKGPEAMAQWVRQQTKCLVTDTTMRDGHQSLLATRVRTDDLVLGIHEAARVLHDAFSFEMWGGATFDVAHRFLHECPWERLRRLRKACPNVCFQMLFRGSNGLGYKSYPDNVIIKACQLAAKNGIDVFRIFDCFNNLSQMQLAIDTVRACGKVAEVCLCFTGDFLSPTEDKYTLSYWRDLALSYKNAGAHMIAIKDMAGLLKPNHAAPLIQAIREVTDLPVHFHTHSTSGVSLASALAMCNAGCDVVDFAISSMSEGTSQPNLNAFVASTMGGPRDTGIDYLSLERLSLFWARQRELYEPFECHMQSGSARVFDHQIPGGQYANLLVQCKAMGLWSRWSEVLDMYRDVNRLCGDLVKVTPSSKSVGDFALYLLNRKMKCEDVITRGNEIDFPASVKDLFAGKMGLPHFSFPKELEQIVLKGEPKMVGRPGDTLAPEDFDQEASKLKERLGRDPTPEQVVSSFLYPKVYEDYCKYLDTYGETTKIPTEIFWYGMEPKQTFELPEDISPDMQADLLGRHYDEWAKKHAGEPIIVGLDRVGPLQNGKRKLYFTVAGFQRIMMIDDEVAGGKKKTVMADPSNKCQLPSPLPGKVDKFLVEEGDTVAKGETIGVVVAMKMEVKITAPFDLVIKNLAVKAGDAVEEGSLIAVVE